MTVKGNRDDIECGAEGMAAVFSRGHSQKEGP